LKENVIMGHLVPPVRVSRNIGNRVEKEISDILPDPKAAEAVQGGKETTQEKK